MSLSKLFLAFVFAALTASAAWAQNVTTTPTPEEEKAPTCNAGFYLSYVDDKPKCVKMPTDCKKNIYGETYCRPCKGNQAMTYVNGEYKCLNVPNCSDGQFLFSDGTKFECRTP